MRALLGLLLLSSAAYAADSTPFFRMGEPYVLSVTTTAQQYALNPPPGATSYRFTNPCNVDVRIRRVESMAETISTVQGTRYLARSVEIVATSNPQFVSLIAMSAPASPCFIELLYGTGQ
jgi:hypothetical protein